MSVEFQSNDSDTASSKLVNVNNVNVTDTILWQGQIKAIAVIIKTVVFRDTILFDQLQI